MPAIPVYVTVRVVVVPAGVPPAMETSPLVAPALLIVIPAPPPSALVTVQLQFAVTSGLVPSLMLSNALHCCDVPLSVPVGGVTLRLRGATGPTVTTAVA